MPVFRFYKYPVNVIDVIVQPPGLAGRGKEKKRMQMYYWLIRERRLFAQNRKKWSQFKKQFHFGCSHPKALYQTAAVLQDPSSTASKGRVQEGQKCHLRGQVQLTFTVKHEHTEKLQKPGAHFQSTLHKWLQPRFIPWAFRGLKSVGSKACHHS